MNKIKKDFLISIILILLAILFTILVKFIDVKQIGINETNIGFATINLFVFKTIGVNIIWCYITEVLGYVSIFIALIYAFIGLVQLIKRKGIYKVDKEIIMLGLFYITVILLYIFFEKIIINYRPILMNKILEPSYPSSHTLMTICICGSSVMVNKKIFNNKITKNINIILILIMVITTIGRLLSGVHWTTDIIGGILISIALLKLLYSFINIKK